MDVMLSSKPIRTGILLIPSQGFLKKSWTKRFYALYEASDHGIQRIEVFESEENFHRQVSQKIIPLTECVKVTTITQKHQSNVFEVVTKSQNFLFSAETFQDMTDWLLSIRSAAFGGNSCKSLSQSQADLSSVASIQNEENLIYSSMDAPEIYPIRICESEVKNNWKLYSTYNLIVTAVGISLSDTGSQMGNIVLNWSYRHIRRYGYSHDTFSFEAGRKSASGEGTVILETKDGAVIFQSIASRVNSLKSIRNEADLMIPMSPSALDDKVFFSSSSPQKQNSLDSPTNRKKETPYAAIKPKPPVSKPPRKSRLIPDVPLSGGHLYEDPASMQRSKTDILYDLPTERQDAWRTLGREVEDLYLADSDSCDPGYEDLSSFEMKKKSFDPSNKKTLEGAAQGNNISEELSHTYGKLNSKNREVSASRPKSIFKKVDSSSQSNSPPYENVLVEKPPDHFVFNEVEYAQVIRKKI